MSSRCCDTAVVAGEATRVAIIHAQKATGRVMKAKLLALEPAASITLVDCQVPLVEWKPRAVDVVLVHTGDGCADMFAPLGCILAAEPWAEVVFTVESDLSPEAAAMRSMGPRYVVSEANLWPWLEVALRPLAEHARARRVLEEAERLIPSTPGSDDDGRSNLTLPQAEERFRETYLRSVLCQHRTRKDAARAAGIPYTTLRSMVEKLQL